MRLTPPSKKNANWIELLNAQSSERPTKFHPLPGGEGRGEGERKITTTYRGKENHSAVKVYCENPFNVRRSMLDVRSSRKKSAFTLIELVIVIVIIGIAAAMIIPE